MVKFIKENNNILNSKYIRAIFICGIFLTRLPFALSDEIKSGELGKSSWAFPIIGLIVGLIGAFIFWVSQELSFTRSVSVGLSIIATIIVTGGLHEDGLADTADGFGGGLCRVSKLRIMRDSSIGVFGAIAVFFSIFFRWVILTDFLDTHWIIIGLLSAGIISRGILPVITWVLPNARQDGLASDFRRVEPVALCACIIITILALLFLCGFLNAIFIIGILCIVLISFSVFVYQQVGGYTGDILGAYQQLSEITTLMLIGVIIRWS